MKTKDRFEETKIKMVMKLKKLSRHAAVEEIAKCGTRCADRNINRRFQGEMISAAEFFGED